MSTLTSILSHRGRGRRISTIDTAQLAGRGILVLLSLRQPKGLDLAKGENPSGVKQSRPDY